MRTTFAMVAGDQTDALVLHDVTLYSIKSIKLSAVGPAFGWTLFFAPTAAAARENIVVIDSTATVPVNAGPNPAASGAVVNRAIDSCECIVPVSASGIPFDIRVTTSGKVGVGTIRIVWDFFDGISGLL